ncbi:TPA: hypothetical protein ACX3KE_002076 [Enterobacter kobei]|uniref:hypothetical protein n=1 Tax=Enterobacter kobei TaxID=208224 RepID=UPI0018A631D9|nr:hypothetical protein [Enterobacter kobei]MCR2776023.1 hypothetical protein [Enterobacter kobei]MCR2797061.1 hypothetical protein [Enterobacter kobei]MDS0023778.1 hypothetical protein [Enterobacter kobei]BBV81332.1 hypothetical protein STW0522ENT60_20100 [Enterobacter kobei]HDT6059972.1 hypothetical protein [Enterobacter kobei]
MVTNNIYPAFIICIFVVFLIIVVTFYIDYRKHSDQVEQIYNLLIKSKLLKIEDYQAWQNLGFWGFGFRAMILSKLLRGKRIKITGSLWLEPQSCKDILSKFDVSWINAYNRKVKIATILFLLLLILASVKDI